MPDKKQMHVKLTIENSVKLDPKSPVPEQLGGQFFVTITGKKYLPFLGRKDNLAADLLSLRLASVTHNRCIVDISAAVVGNGIYTRGQDNDKALFEWMKKVNNDGYSFDEAMQKIVECFKQDGNSFIEVVRGEINKQKFLKINLHPVLYCRLSEPDDSDETPFVYISKLFARRGVQTKDLDKATQIPLYCDNILDKTKVWAKNPDGTESTMLHFKNEYPGLNYYGLPDSIPSLRSQAKEAKYEQLDLDDLDNNMSFGGVIAFKSAMTREEAQEQGENIVNAHSSEGKGGRWAFLSAENGIEDVVITPFNYRKEGNYLEAMKSTSSKIIKSHGWSAMLLEDGEQKGSMGRGSGLIRAIWDAKEASVLNPIRRKLLDKVIVPLMKIYAEHMGSEAVGKADYWFNSAMPFSFLGDLDPSTFVQVNEAREMSSLPADETMKGVYLAQLAKPKDVPGNATQ